MRIIGFFFRHYEPWVDKFIFFDDGSTDGTLELLASKKNVEVRPFTYAFPDSFSLSVQAWRNSCWKESRGEADWVIVTDVGRASASSRSLLLLGEVQGRGRDLYAGARLRHGDGVCSRSLRSISPPAIRSVLQAPSTANSEFSIPSPSRRSITVSARHTASPSGRLVLPAQDDLLLLHYKHLGTNYVPARHAALGARLRERDLKNGWGVHYLFDDRRYGQYLADLTGRLVDVTDASYVPSRDHREERWWRPEFAAAVSPAEAR